MLQHAGAVVVLLPRVLLHFTQPLVLDPCIQMHAARVEPDEKRLVGRLSAAHELDGSGDDLLAVEIAHPLPGQWPRVLDRLKAHVAEARVGGSVALVAGERVDDPARPELRFVLLETA